MVSWCSIDRHRSAFRRFPISNFPQPIIWSQASCSTIMSQNFPRTTFRITLNRRVRERGPLAMRENYLLMLPQFDKLLAEAKTLPTSQSRFAINKVRKPKTFTSLSSCSVSSTSLPTPSDKGNRTDTIKVFLFHSFSRVEKAFEVSAASNSSFDLGKRENLWICEKPRTRAAFVAWRVWKNSLITLNNEQGRPALSHV